jgi:hypothetical protein
MKMKTKTTKINRINIPIPIVYIIIWLEINIYGKTIIPELFCIFNLWLYIVGRILYYGYQY